MRYFIGIAIGLVIVFNWSSIKSYFDKNITEQAVPATVQGQSIGTPQEPIQKQTDKSDSPKQDLFKEFK